MKRLGLSLIGLLILSSSVYAEAIKPTLPSEIQTIIDNPRYQHATWAIFSKDLQTGQVLYQMNEDRFFIPASTSKLISIAAILNQFGDDYRFKTPVYALGPVDAQGVVDGNIVLVGKGDLVFGGRALPNDKVAFTNFDHTDANHLPGATLTPQDPLAGIQFLAKQIKQHGVKTIKGDVLVDDSLFETMSVRGDVLSPIMINENFFDVEVMPGAANQAATVRFRPQLNNTKVINKVMTVDKGKESKLVITSNATGDQFEISGTIAVDNKHMLNTYPIKDPKAFARLALIQALLDQGITIENKSYPSHLPTMDQYATYKPLATFVSPLLVDYAKLILKVSHNMGANLVPLLLASVHGKKTYEDGMLYIGQFLQDTAHVNLSDISFGDAAGGDSNYLTPSTMMKVLEYFYQMPPQKFKRFLGTLPILGVDGSLSAVAKTTPAKGHVFAKTGTSLLSNLLKNDTYFLPAKALAGFYQAKNNHWIAFYIVVNRGYLNTLMEVLKVNNDLGIVANALYTSDSKALN